MSLPRILIADDSEINRKMLSVIFENQYEIYEASDGQMAIEMIELIEGLSLLLLDLNMPMKSGYEVLKYLKEKQLTKHLPIIVVTSSTEETDEIFAFNYGAAEIVHKPFIPEVILKRAENLIELYDSRRNLENQLNQRTDELVASKKYDKLTGLLSMSEFLTSADQILSYVKSADKSEYTFVYINIHNFKFYNVKYGINRGDNVLRSLAMLISEIQHGNLFTRYGQDHFVILTRDSYEQIYNNALRIYQGFSAQFSEGMQLKFGIYHLNQDNIPTHTACELAKLACDSIKYTNDFFCEYNETLKHKFELSTYVIQHIDEAIAKRYIQVYFQPVVRTLSGKVCGTEALARWNDPTLGLLSPADFISTLEENRLIQKLDLFVLREVCEVLKTRSEHKQHSVPVSLNLSRVDFQECDIFYEVEKILQEYKLPHDLINIEITETAIMSDPIRFKEEIDRFRKAGYQVWMDDFGSGYSSLNVLKDYSFDEIKLDMKFMSSFDAKSKDIVVSIIEMAKKIGIQTLAEGVETQEQYDFLRSIGCEKVQGYFVSKPIPSAELEILPIVNERNLERRVWKKYFEKLGKVKFTTDQPLALIEYDGFRFDYLFMNHEYEEMLISTGVQSIPEARNNMNVSSSSLSKLFREFIETCHEGDGVKELLYSIRGRYVKAVVECIAEYDKHATFLTTIVNLSDYELVKQQTQLAEISGRLYDFFDGVFLCDLNTNSFETIRTGIFHSTSTHENLYTGNELNEAIRSASYMIYPSEKKEFLAFTDPSTIKERISQSEHTYITYPFRTMIQNGAFVWKAHTILFVEDKNQVLYCTRYLPLTEDGKVINYANETETDENILLHGLQKWVQQGVMNSSTINMFWKDKNRRFVGANQSFLNTYGFDSVAEIIGKTDEDMGWHIQDEPFASDELRVLEGETITNRPGICNIKGVAHNILASKEPIYEDGEIVGLSGYFIDANAIEKVIHENHDLYQFDEISGLLSPQGIVDASAKLTEEWFSNGQNFAVIRLTLNEYMRVLNSYGETVAKNIFNKVGEIIGEYIGIRGTCARLFAGEFIILMRCDDKIQINITINNLVRILKNTHTIFDYPLTMYPQVSISFADEEDDVFNSLANEARYSLVKSNIPGIADVDLAPIYSSYEELSEIAIFVDMDTRDVLYMNRIARDRYGVTDVNQIKYKKCFQILQGKECVCPECTDEIFIDGQSHERVMFNPHLDDFIRIKEQLVYCNGRRILIQIAYELSKNSGATVTHDERVIFKLNEAIRLAFENSDYDDGIQGLMEQLGQILKADRTYLFEMLDGKSWTNSYEWCGKGVVPQKDNLINIPMSDTETWNTQFNRKQYISIRDIEEIKENDRTVYDYLKPQDIHSIIVAPIFINNELYGFYGVDNPPAEIVDVVASSIKTVTNSIEILVNQRDINKQLTELSYRDTLSELGNRHAVNREYENLDKSKSIGVIFCDVCGLKFINDSLGHAAGDKILLQARDLLKTVFGEYHIFRWGGDEMLILASGISKTEFDERCQKLIQLCNQENAVIAIGSVWENEIKSNIIHLVNRADEKMYEHKQKIHNLDDFRAIYKDNEYLKDYYK